MDRLAREATARVMRPTAASPLPGRLLVFFTRGMSLKMWQQAGLLERELALYRAMRPRLSGLAFLTYGGMEERLFDGRLDGIRLLPNRWRLRSNLYSVVAPLLHARAMRQATVFKTNQLNGAWSAAIAKRLFRKKLIVRCGYIWSDFYARLDHPAWKVRLARRLERWVVRQADRLIVATDADRRRLVSLHRVDADKVAIIPNYIDTKRFRPMPEVEKAPGLICFIGRLEAQKNPLALLEAIKGMPNVRLAIVGEGSLRSMLERRAREWQLPVEWLGIVPHERLPELLNRAQLFILPSHFEGHPKALLEAMACGLPVIGARSPGVQELLVHRETGYLCGTSAAEIRAAVAAVLEDAVLARHMAEQARVSVETACSLDTVAQEELALLADL